MGVNSHLTSELGGNCYLTSKMGVNSNLTYETWVNSNLTSATANSGTPHMNCSLKRYEQTFHQSGGLGAQQPCRGARVPRDKPIFIRYDSMYAAHFATGIWKAKKHKPMAAAARRAWARLKRSREGRAWMAHVKGHAGNLWNERERTDRAGQGRVGKSFKRYESA